MADDIADLRARVEAARDRLSDDAAIARKVELRLEDLVRIVEGSLARQASELDSARHKITDLEADLGRALARAEQALGEASRAERLAKENGELKHMVMALLEVIEDRQKSPLGAVMQKLEKNVSALVVPASALDKPDVAPSSLSPGPEAPESETPEPEAPEPEAPEPDASEPDASEPETSEPMTPGPEPREPLATTSIDVAPEQPDATPVDDIPAPENVVALSTDDGIAAADTGTEAITTEIAAVAMDTADEEFEAEVPGDESVAEADSPNPDDAPVSDETAPTNDDTVPASKIEDLTEIALYDATDEVIEPERP